MSSFTEVNEFRRIKSIKVENIAKSYLVTTHSAFSFEDIIVWQRSATSWIVEGCYNNPSLGWFYFII